MRPWCPFGLALAILLAGGCGGKIASTDAGATPLAAPECPSQSASGTGASGTTLLATIPAAGKLVVDACNAYVVSGGSDVPSLGPGLGDVYRVALDGRGATALGSIAGNDFVAMDPARIYTSGQGGEGGETSPQDLVVACAKTGCQDGYTTLASGQDGIYEVAVDDSNAYWTDLTNDPQLAGVWKVPLTGGAPTALVSAVQATEIVVADGKVFFKVESPTSPTLTNTAMAIASLPVAGGPMSTFIIPDNAEAGPLTADANNVYFATSSGGIWKLPIAGGPAAVLSMAAEYYTLLAIDDGYLYFTGSNGIDALPITGGSVVTVIPTQDFITGLAVDASWIYWTTLMDAAGNSKVMKAPKG